MMGSAAPAPGEEPILVDLAGVGFEVGSLADLRRSGVRRSRSWSTGSFVGVIRRSRARLSGRLRCPGPSPLRRSR
jgi:hypothetical protein